MFYKSNPLIIFPGSVNHCTEGRLQVGISLRSRIHSISLLLPAMVMILTASIANGQTANVPVFTDYRGVRIGMAAEEVRAKLDQLKKGEGQDFLVFSEQESAQIYYDDKGQVTAISIDYFGDNSKAPAPETVVGVTLQAKADGSMYQLKRYPEAGYWVSYNRTAGDKPIVTITMQKM
jgi:hypothetical protein